MVMAERRRRQQHYLNNNAALPFLHPPVPLQERNTSQRTTKLSPFTFISYLPAYDVFTRLAKPRGARRPGAPRPLPSSRASSAAMQQQQSLPAFGQGNGAQQSSSSFGQQANGNTQNQTSQSFPPFGGSTNNTSGFGSAFTAPSGSFSFNTPPVSNPFTRLDAGAPVTSQNGGFYGSIFRFEAPLDERQRELTGEATPLFAPGAPSGVLQENGTTEDQPKTTSNGFTWPPQQQQGQASSSIFQQSKQPSVLDQAINQAKVPTTSLFGNASSPLVQNTNSSTASSTSNMFSHVETPQPVQKQSSENPFAAGLTKVQEDQKKPMSNLFGNLDTQSSHPSTNLFNATPTAGAQTQSTLFSPEAMQTSPDTTPQKASPTQSTPFSFATNANNQPQPIQAGDNTAFTNGGSLFDRITKPSSGTPPQASTSLGQTGEGPSTGGDLFGRVSAPTTWESETNTGQAEPTTTAKPTSSLFSRVTSLDKPQEGTSRENTPLTDPSTSLNAMKQDELDRGGDEITPKEIPGPWSVPTAPCYFSEEEKIQFRTGLRLKRLDLGFNANLPNYSEKEARAATEFYYLQKQAILDAGYGPVEEVIGKKRQASSIYQSESPAPKKHKTGPLSHDPQSVLRKDAEDSNNPVAPNKTNGPLQPLANTNTKRKADQELARGDTSATEENAKRVRGPDSPQKSQTASLFSNILDTSNKVPSPEKSRGVVNGAGNGSASGTVPSIFQPKAPSTNTPFGVNFGSTSSSSFFQPTSVDASSSLTGTPNSLANTTTDASAPTMQPLAQAPPQPFGISGPGISPLKVFNSPKTSLTGPKNFGSTASPTSSTPALVASSNSATNPLVKPNFGSTAAVPTSSAPAPASNAPTAPLTKQTFGSTSAAPTSSTSAPAASADIPAAAGFIPMFEKAGAGVSVNKAAPTGVKPPTFGNVPSTNFMSQFGESAKKDAELAKKKRKAQEYDSEEEDEASWEKKDAEEQQKKRHKIEEAAKTAQKFVPTIGSNSASSTTTEDETTAPPPISSPKSQSTSVFDTTHPDFKNTGQANIFGHLAKNNVGVESGKDSEADDEDDDGNEHQETAATTRINPSSNALSPAQPLGRSLFDRVSKDSKSTSPTKQDASNSQGSPTMDQTWKANSPINFGTNATSSQSPPAVNVTPESPSKLPLTGLFGVGNTVQPPFKPGPSPFSNLQPTAPSSGLSFGFGPLGPGASTLAPPSNFSSRATSPGATTGESATESGAEGADDATQKDEQANLISERAGEENEDVLHEVRAKGLRYDVDIKMWVSKGVGPLRILKHRETGKRRILLRADPSGKIAINSGFLKEGKYEHIGCNTVRAMLASEDGSIGTWHLRTKDNEDGKRLSEVLNENKKYGS